MVSGLDERAAFSFSGERTSGLDLLLELGGRKGASTDVDSLALDALIRARALVLDEMMFRHRVVASTADPGTATLARHVIERQSEVARQALEGPSNEGETEFLARLAGSEEALAGAQRRLAARSSDFGRLIASRGVGLLEVSHALPDDAALVCMARYVELGPAAGEDQVGSEHYVAFVLRAGQTQPERIALGEAIGLDQMITTWLALARAAPDPLRRAACKRELRAAGLAVRARVFDPLLTYVDDARVLFLVPDAALALVPFAALPGDSAGYLVEQAQTLHLLATERDLVDVMPGQRRGTGMLALGGVDYALARVPCASVAGAGFPPLPGSLAEADAIAAFWLSEMGEQVETLRGARGSEANVRKLAPGRRVLHLATHGFFLDGACLDARGHALAAPYRAGIVLSVGNARSRPAGNLPDGRDDGWLTAGEIAGLDLSGVEWAVFSACRSGQGEIVLAGEELLGLRRALRIAGVATVITSLWEVEDFAAREWMDALYDAKWKRGLSTADAVRDACQTVLRARRERGQSDHPSSWANFAAFGDWR
jgi:CHAT domain-containing protein